MKRILAVLMFLAAVPLPAQSELELVRQGVALFEQVEKTP